jgi:negative regulator of flagellin synthesis FlgM
MPNDINSLTNGRTQHSGDRQVQSIKRDTSRSSSSAESDNSSSSDKVSLTSTAAKLKELEQKLASQPDVDMRRVSEVQNAIADGKYKVDPEHVADKMMNFEENF